MPSVPQDANPRKAEISTLRDIRAAEVFKQLPATPFELDARLLNQLRLPLRYSPAQIGRALDHLRASKRITRVSESSTLWTKVAAESVVSK
jgi:hypothetical protein